MGEPDNDASKRPPDPNALEAQITSELSLAGEALVGNGNAEASHYAAPEADESVPLLGDYDWLRGLAAHVRQVIAEDPRRTDLLRRLPQGLGDGEVLQILFDNLFPEQRLQRKEARRSDGKRRLTTTQIDVLREIAQGKTPGQIAAQRGCTVNNIHSILKSIEDRLSAGSPQESVAVAISMGYLPLDVMDFVREAGHCEVRDYTPLGWHVAAYSLENIESAAVWQELASFGLLLLLATGAVSLPLQYAAHPPPAAGVLCRLEPERSGTYRVRQVVGPGRLRRPFGLAIAPQAARRQGFTPGHLYIVHYLAAQSGLNVQEIVEYAPDGEEQRAFCGGRSLSSRLSGAKDLLFDASGALLVTGGNALLRFTVGGERVHPLILQCCTSVCSAPKGLLTLAHSSSRGGSLGVYTRYGRLRRQFAQLPVEIHFSSLQPLPGDEVAALRYSLAKPEEPMMQIYNADGEFLRCWRVPGASYCAFALNARDNLLYIPCCESNDIAVYMPDGTLQSRIALEEGISPYAVTFDREGALWCIGDSVSG